MINSPKLYELVAALCVKLEHLNPELIQRARASWNPNYGTLNGDLAGQILEHIGSILSLFDDDIKRSAYNEIADSEGLVRIDKDRVGFDSWICESLLDPVIDMLMGAEREDNSSKRRSLH